MENKLFFILVLSGCILVFLGVIITFIYLWMEQKRDWMDYESYILSISWAPSSCFNKKDKKEDCFNELDILDINKSFIIHGLWPVYNSGKITQNCNKGDDIKVSFNNKTYEESLTKVWPRLNLTNNNEWEYEYNEHGYCFIQRKRKNVEKDVQLYFDKTMEIFSNYNELIESMIPDTEQGLRIVSKDRFKFLLNSSAFKLDKSTYSLRCERNEENNADILTEIWINYNFDLKNKTNSIELADNCPKRFFIYFRDENKIPFFKKFDFYVLSLYWPVTYCQIYGEECYKKLLKKKVLNMLTIHGLWPSYQTGTIPQWCNLDTDIPINDYYEEMDKYWINTFNKENKELWSIEYNKHGYCYNQRKNISTEKYMNYFKKTLELYHKFNFSRRMAEEFYPGIYSGENKLDREYLQTRMQIIFGRNTFSFTCLSINEEYYLKEIRLKLNLNLIPASKGKTGDDCPGQFYAEFLEVEGPKPQAPADYYKIYDMYFFTIEWQGTQCRERGKDCYFRIPHNTRNHFVMHGLWPNLRNGTIVQEFCNGANDIFVFIKNKTLLEFMKQYYVGLYHSNFFFWGHEYNKHGYCYNQRVNHDVNDYEFYFNKIKDIFQENNFANLLIDFLAKEKIVKKIGDMKINRTKFESFFNDKGFSKDKYLIVCRNITDEYNETNPHIYEIRIRYDLDFNLLKNETDVSEFDCPEIFYAEFL